MEKITVITPTSDNQNKDKEGFKIFLAGTIDNGDSTNWQKEFIERAIANGSKETNNVVIYNPRRDDFEAHSLDYQIDWELDHLEKADIIIMNILPNSKSPISLMELGLFARSGKLNVFCDPTFYRYKNVEHVCKKYNVELLSNKEL